MTRRRRHAATAGTIAAMLMGVMFLAFSPEGAPSCGPLAGEHRPLDLRLDADRAHLDEDIKAIRRAAERFRQMAAQRPLLSQSIDAREGARTAPARARAWCEATLTEAVVELHQIQADQVRLALDSLR
jgi:hypothetical protein